MAAPAQRIVELGLNTLSEQALGGPLVDVFGVHRISDPFNPDDLVGQKGLKIYDKMLCDAQVKLAVMLKKHAILAPGWEIMTPDDGDEALTDFVNETLENLSGSFEHTLLSILDAIPFGFSVHELVFENIGGRITLVRLPQKPAKTFDFEQDEFGNLLPDGIIQFQHQVEERRLPVDKFIHYVHNKRDQNPYGESDLRAAYPFWFSKDTLDRFWNLHLQKLAKNPLIAKVPAVMDEDQKKALGLDLDGFQNKAYGVFDDRIVFEFLEMQAHISEDFHQKQQYNDKMIARAVILPDLAASEGERVGSMALGKVHADMLDRVLEAEARNLEAGVNEQLIQRIVLLAFPGTEVFPEFTINAHREEDIMELISAFEKLVNMGAMSPKDPLIATRTNFPLEEFEEPTPQPPQDDDEEPLQFAESALKKKIESKVKTRQLERKLDRLQTAGIEKLSLAFRETRKDLTQKFLDESVEPKKIRVPGTQLKRIIEGVLTNGFLHGQFDALTEIRRNESEAKVVKFQEIDLEAIAPEDAIEFFDGKVPITLEVLDNFDDLSKTLSDDLLGGIREGAKRILLTGLMRGTPRNLLTSSLNELFEGFIQTGELRDGAILQPNRLEAIVRTNLISAYNGGRWSMMNEPEVREFVPAVMYSAIVDSRVTEFCRRWDGVILRRDDPRAKEIVPPNHFQCRSILVPITTAEEFEITETLPTIRPSRGFSI